MTKQRKLWLLFFVEAIIILFIIYQVRVGLHQKPTLDYVNDNFNISIPVKQMNCLYQIDNWVAWAGDGFFYSVWQCEEDAPLIAQAQQWQQGQAFQQDLFITVVDDLTPDGYFVPRELQQNNCYYLIAKDARGLNQILLIFTPQVKLGDGLQYKNVLFVIEKYL